MTVYRAKAERSGRFWHIEVPEIDRVTQARYASEVASMARELITLHLDLAMADVDVDVEWLLPGAAGEHLARSAQLREQAAKANSASAREARQAARVLHDAGFGSTEIGTVMGVSRQRAFQFISS